MVLPGLWVQSVMRRYREPANRYPRTGGQTARQLLDALGLRNVTTEVTEHGTTTTPTAKVVRLSSGNSNGRSLPAVTSPRTRWAMRCKTRAASHRCIGERGSYVGCSP